MSKKGNKNASKYSEAKVIKIVEMVSNGSNIVDSCKKHNVSYSTWCNWKRQKRFVLDLYARARQDKAEYLEAIMDSVISDLRDNNIDYSSARIIIDTLKWKMAKFYPRMFGADIKIIQRPDHSLQDQIQIYIPDNGRDFNTD